MSRAEELLMMKEDFRLPELHSREYLLDLFFKLKPLRSGAEGDAPTDWNIIHPFAESNGLDADDTDILATMCYSYAKELRIGENALAIEPVDRKET